MDRKIAIAGLGMVGGALAKWFKGAILYDPPKGMGSVEELNVADVVFICVPTPTTELGAGVFLDEGKAKAMITPFGSDVSAIKLVVDALIGNKIIVVKSTVLPGTLQAFQEHYPQHRFLFNPEFLTESTADQDMNYPDRQIIGYTKESFTIAGEIMAILPLAPYEKIMPAKDAEMVKYMNNTWFSTKVVWANQMYDLCQKLGIDYEIAKEAMAQDKRIGRSHLEIIHKGYRGYRGKCLPKDTQSLIKFADNNGVDMKLLKVVEEINNNLKNGDTVQSI